MKNRYGYRDRHEVRNLEGKEDDFSGVVTHEKIMKYIEGKEF